MGDEVTLDMLDDEDGDGPVEVQGPEAEEKGEAWMAVKPFIGALKAPSNAPQNSTRAPDEHLELDWVYGYRGHDCRDNAILDTRGRAVYPIAGFIVAYDAKQHTQETFRCHNDDILCLCQSPVDQDIIATGQVATVDMSGRSKKPFICVTNVATGETTRLPALHGRAVRCVAFSKDGQYLASVGADNNNTLMIWDWQARRKVAEAKGDTNKIMCIEWSSVSPNQLVTTGVKHVFFWKWSGTRITKSRGRSGKFGIQSFFCHKYTSKGNVFCGTKDGSVMLYDSNGQPKKKEKTHKGAVFAVASFPGGFASGGKDGFLRTYNTRLQKQWSVKLPGRIRSITQDGTNFLIGNHRSELYLIPVSGVSEAPKPILTGHFEGEIWSCEVQDNGSFLTAGEDNRVIRWSISDRRDIGSGKVSTEKPPKWRRKFGVSTTSRLHPSLCARAVSQFGGDVALGRNDGKVAILDAKTLNPKTIIDINRYSKRKVNHQKGNWIEAMSYSPNGKTLAVGTHGIAVVLLDVDAGYKVKKTLKKSNAVLTYLDWSKDSRHLRTNDKGYELLFYDIDQKNLKNSKQNTYPTALKDVEWASNSCILTWETQCIWDTDMDGSDVHGVDVNKGKTLVVTGDNNGNVNLFRYPVLDAVNRKRIAIGHSSHVTRVKFTPNGRYVISTGGNDKSVVQWRVVGADGSGAAPAEAASPAKPAAPKPTPKPADAKATTTAFKYEKELKQFETMGFKNTEEIKELLVQFNGNIPAVTQAIMSNRKPAFKYAKELAQFKSMGFRNVKEIKSLLVKNNGDVQAVTAALFS